ncbi:MAG: hypothetical protein ABGW87_10785 [Sphingomonadaceae bacterium]
MALRRNYPPLAVVAFIVTLQAVAACFFLIDGISDLLDATTQMTALEATIEALVAFALLAGIALGLLALRAAAREARTRDQALAIARGALAEAIERQFNQWRLTPAEADVALFALKGCKVDEIARLRSSAKGTVRAQLSQIYAKAAVTSQAELMASLFEDLLPPATP